MFRLLAHTTVAVLLAAPFAAAEAPETVEQVDWEDRLPYGQQPVDYHGGELDDPVQDLAARIRSGEAELEYDGPNGYLRSLLDALDVPVESQLLVFSKTALNPRLVGPERPRAVYFADEVYVGWVPGAASIEISANDPRKGAVFYTLRQSADDPPRFERETRCLACHAGRTTLQVPGHLARSFVTDEKGRPVSGFSRTTHESEISKRWGGWYVTGKPGRLVHRGNLFGDDVVLRHRREPAFRGSLERLDEFVDTSAYLTSSSDVLPHLVLEHQAHGQNLITRVGFEHRLGRRSDAEERLVRYLFFADEAELPEAVETDRDSGYREWFESRGPRDSQGRSLRELDLQTRLLKYRLSWLVDSPAFEALPKPVKQRVYGRMLDVLTGRDDSIPLEEAERRVILEILRATQRDLPAEWGRQD